MQKHEIDQASVIGALAWPLFGGYLGHKVFRWTGGYLQLSDREPWIAVGVIIGLGAAVFFAWFLRNFADDGFRGARYKRWLRGSKMENWHGLRSRVDSSNSKFNKEERKCGRGAVSPIMIGKMPMPLYMEDRHTLLCATTGAGKSTVLEHMISSAFFRRDKMVIVDPNGTFFSKFGLSGDTILNPFDTRSVGWSVFNEIHGDYDFDRMAKSIIPPQISPEDEQWCSYTRDLLSDTMRQLARHGNRRQVDLIDMLIRQDTDTLRTFLENSDSQGYFRDNADRAIASVQFMINKYVRPLRLLEQVGNTSFSLHDWLHNPEPGNLYISWREDMRSAQRPLVATWIDTICATILSYEPMGLNRFWLFLDELESLGRLESFVPAATKGRKHGLRIVGTIQDWSQLDETYGKDAAKTLLACFRNYVILAASNALNADRASEILGKMQVERLSVSKNTGKGSSTTRNIIQCPPEPCVLDTEISNLKDLEAYVMFGADYPISKCTIPYFSRPVRHPAISVR